MKTNPLPGLIGLGCASALTRAGGGVEKMELIPLYFYDDDNHLFELHTGTLEERLERYRRGVAR